MALDHQLVEGTLSADSGPQERKSKCTLVTHKRSMGKKIFAHTCVFSMGGLYKNWISAVKFLLIPQSLAVNVFYSEKGRVFSFFYNL